LLFGRRLRWKATVHLWTSFPAIHPFGADHLFDSPVNIIVYSCSGRKRGEWCALAARGCVREERGEIRRSGREAIWLAPLEKRCIPIGRQSVAALWRVDQRIHGKQLDTRSAFRGR
jgi:hypothetical protein